MTTSAPPRLWRQSHPHQGDAPTMVGRQGVFNAHGDRLGYELLFRAAGLEGARADLWSASDQDLATEHVIAASFHQEVDVTQGHDASVNFTGDYLLSHSHLYCDPTSVIVEIVESTTLSAPLLDRVEELSALGYRIALDDFTGTEAQCALMPFATFVKVDLQDIAVLGTSIVDRARGGERVLVAERVETAEQLKALVALGFDQFQGHLFHRAEVLDIPVRAKTSPKS